MTAIKKMFFFVLPGEVKQLISSTGFDLIKIRISLCLDRAAQHGWWTGTNTVWCLIPPILHAFSTTNHAWPLPWEQISIASQQRYAKVSPRISVSCSPLPGILSEPALAGRALPDQNLIGSGPQKSWCKLAWVCFSHRAVPQFYCASFMWSSVWLTFSIIFQMSLFSVFKLIRLGAKRAN